MGLIKYPAFIGDAERIDLDRAMSRIAKAVSDRRVDFLFGAGMSAPKPSCVPAGRELAERLLELYFPDGASATDPSKVGKAQCPTCGSNVDIPARTMRLQTLAAALPFESIVEAIENGPGKKRGDLTAYLRQILLKDRFELNQAHKEFNSVCYWDGQTRVRRVFTTNFDPLIEEALGAHGVRVTEKNAAEIDAIQDRKQIPVLHLHGTLDEEYQITESDIFDDRFRNLHSRLRMALDDADAFVFVGYSMSDPDFRSVYLKHRNEMQLRKDRRKDAYVVAPARDHYAYSLAKGVWQARYAIYLPLDAESFFAGIKLFLDQTSRKDLQAAIMKKYRLMDENAYLDKVKQTAEILRIDNVEAEQFLFEARTKTGGRE
ncbi:MAG TPA: SIR2 family protein [Candidatus Eisenbacteria bacterium]|jgi:hypothetical protein|nr:SIR2 family protein [Candidatus Eisenbacteria bacterium]